MTNDIYVSMAEDLIANCGWCNCIYEEEDDFGRIWINGYCPFYDKDDDSCMIGDPTTWRLEERI